MKENVGFLNIEERDNGDLFWKGFPVENFGGNKPKINEKVHNITPGIQKVLTETSNIPLKKLNNRDREIHINILESLDLKNFKAIRGESKSGRYKQSKNIFKKHNWEGQGVKIIKPSNVFDIYTSLEVLLGLKHSEHSDILTEASNLIDELHKRGEIQTEKQYRIALNKFSTLEKELPSKLLEQIAFNTRPKIEEHMLIIMDKSTHEEHIPQPLQTNKKQFKIAITFLTDYIGIFNVTNSNIKFYFKKSFIEEDFIQIRIPNGV